MGNGILRRPSNAVEPTGLNTVNRTVVKTHPDEIDEGRCVLFAGVNTGTNGNTCPILAVYRWKKATEAVMQEDSNLQGLGGPGGGQLDRARTTLLKDFTEKREFKLDVEQSIEMLPIEDIISIKVSTEVKKQAHEKVEKSLVEKPPEELTCCEEVTKCCKEKVCCCCCKQDMLDQPEYREKSTVRRTAKRHIIITITRTRFGLLETPSNIRLLSKEEQNKFYHNRFHIDTVKFSYMKGANVDEKVYKDAIQACETLARIVMQLKGMIGHYPDKAQLKDIVEQKATMKFGQEVSEDIEALKNSSTDVSIRQDTEVSLRS